MQESFYKKVRNNTTYGGELSVDDFNTCVPNKRRISNQIVADNLQSDIQNKILKRREQDWYKSMTLEELREMKILSNTDGRPHSTLTDEKWQKEFAIRKCFVTPYKNKRRFGGKYSTGVRNWNEEQDGAYNGCTQWQSYVRYMNDVLSNIRAGQVDYCYFIYQIMDLAKFHLNTLCTRYQDGYWEVWLER